MVPLISKILVLLYVIEVTSVDDFLRGQSVLYGLASLAEDDIRNTTCTNHLHELYDGINLKHFWALKVLDASGQPGSGFLWGNNLWLGSHSQCTDISNRRPFEINYSKVKHADPTPYDFPPYLLEFAMVHMRHNNTQQNHAQMPLENLVQLGLCIPASCSADELEVLLHRYLERRYLNVQQMYELNLDITNVKILEGHTWINLPKTITAISVCVLGLFLAIVGAVVESKTNKSKEKKCKVEEDGIKNHIGISTIGALKRTNGLKDVESPTHNNNVEKEEKPDKHSSFTAVLKCFSINSNTKALFKTRQGADAIGSVHGVRFFSLLWVICVHSVFYQIDYLENVPTGFRLSEAFLVQILSNSTYCVDSFLFLSGFLISYTYYKSKKGLIDSKKPVNIPAKITEFFTMFLYRYLRLTPVYIVSILLSDSLFAYYRQASSLYSSEQPDINCPKYWWRNILYINNLYPRSEMCMSWSWYLSVDTQFFVIASFLLILSTVTFKVAAGLVFSIIGICMVVTGYSSYSVGYIPTMDEQFIYLDAIYDFPWNRMGPYLIGFIAGYILEVKLEGQLHLKKPYLVLMWIIFPAINLWILFTLYGRELSLEFSAVYMGISRTLWGFGLAWLFIACCTGNAGVVNKFLSFQGWVPLSRLTYCAYLLNPIMISIIYLGAESSQTSSLASFTLAIFGSAFLTFFLAYFLSVCFESPFILLTKLMFDKLKQKKKIEPNPA